MSRIAEDNSAGENGDDAHPTGNGGRRVGDAPRLPATPVRAELYRKPARLAEEEPPPEQTPATRADDAGGDNGPARENHSRDDKTTVRPRDKQPAAKDAPEREDAAEPAQEKAPAGGDNENPPAKKPAKPPLHKRPVFWIVLAAVLIVGGIIATFWWLDVRYKVTTDDAFITAHNVIVSPRVAGHVNEVRVDDNQDVKKGDLLVVLDDRDFVQAVKGAQASYEMAKGQLAQAEAQVASAQASVAQAQADVLSAEASAKQAESDLQRYLNVQKLDARAVSQQQVDQAQATARTTAAQLNASQQKKIAADAQVKVAQAQIVSANAAIDKAKSDVDNAQLQLSYTKVYAAEDGQVTNRSVEVGNYVTPGQALMALVPRMVWVTANYKETQLKHVRVGDSATIHVDAYGMDLAGQVDSIQAGSGAAFSLLPPENATGNYVKVVQRIPVKIVFKNEPQRRLAPGMSVEATVKTQPQE